MPQPSRKPSRSIFATVLVPMVVLLVLEAVVFIGTLVASGAFPRMDESNREILDQQVASRADSLENYLVGTVGNLEPLASEINASVEGLVEQGQLDLATMADDAVATRDLQLDIINPMIDTLREKRVSGVFVLFNTESLAAGHESGSYGKLPGVFIRDMDPAATPSARNEDLVIECSASEVVQQAHITTDADWRPRFALDNYPNTNVYDFVYQTFQVPFEVSGAKNATDFAYWGMAPHLGSNADESVVTYSIPLILGDGTVYGLVGVDLEAEYLRSLLPYQELIGDQASSFVLARMPLAAEEQEDSGVAAEPVVFSGRTLLSGAEDGEAMMLTDLSSERYEFHDLGQTFYISSNGLRLYNTNSPVEDAQWSLLGMVPASVVTNESDALKALVGVATGLMLLLGGIGAFVIGRSISSPVRRLSEEVSAAQTKMHVSAIPELSSTGISEVDQLTEAITSLSHDIASVKVLEQQRMEYERDYDLLTGLMNRRAFYREADAVFSDQEKLKHAAIVMLDIDNLKDINDEYGHDWGDKYVHAAARSFEAAIPSNVVLGRVSGDEFYLLFYGYNMRDELQAAIEHLKETVQATGFMFPDGKRDHIHVSGGVAVYVDDADEFTELMRLADFTMYQVKDSGKNDIAYFDEETYLHESANVQAITSLRELLADFNLATYYFQPIFDSHTGRPFAYEALLRVSLEGLSSPAEVLAFARREKRLVEVERLTWTRSLECYTHLAEVGQVNDDAHLFINTFPNLSLPSEELYALARDFQAVMGKLVIEITEAETMDEEAMAIKRGIPGFKGQFALDDYGSGYNSEIMLLDLKPNFIKVDISIIRDIDSSVDKQRIVSQVVEYAHERGMKIVAEGIETSSELATVLSLDVDLLQGYYLAKPAAVPEFINPDALNQIRERIG